ncbi:MAG: flagellar hook protein FlgE [Gammaproteobacteria bacterium]|jgi:flagellar hook protein FlgE
MAFSSALSGLSAAQIELDVVSNNIANANTTGFKRSEVEFADVYAVSQSGTAQDSVGKGVTVSGVAQQHTQGEIQITENALDLAISGKGFFTLSDNGTTVYSRSGAFNIDRDGFIINSSGQNLTGFQADAQGAISASLGNLQVSFGDATPQASSALSIGANLDAAETIPPPFNVADPLTYTHSASTTLYDSLGTSHVSTMYFRKDAVNSWEMFTYVDSTQLNAAADVLNFDALGQLSQVNGAAASIIPMPPFGPGNGSAPMTITLDVSGLTQFGGGFGINAIDQDGFPTGRLTSIDIDETGVLQARFSNGRSGPLGQVALSNFSNVNGLRAQGNTGFSETFTSGAAVTATPGSTNMGLLQSGALEQSNVDLTTELVAMIGAQRSFQANAQVISANEEITETVINIAR